MIKLIAIGGEPGSGKTTLMRAIIKQLRGLAFCMVFDKLLVYNEYPRLDLALIGDYSDPAQTFAGTDRLSMAVQPKFLEYLRLENLRAAHDSTYHRTVLFEGDRLFNKSVFEFCLQHGIPFEIVRLVTSPETRQKRCALRNSNQNPTFLKSRITKVESVCSRFSDYLTTFWFDTYDHPPDVLASKLIKQFNLNPKT